ncbi:PLP-dependent aminotransferase family protein [Rudaea sp.]|uniref:MocR-like pyridoxine biosynthesis transcription factor PdxR n=2 Tax=unclassified Rudaea TaxID=2627037 RepID=UPI0025DF4B28|nr:PLP-dependent aminotransferase family protein [Rudaea sp.]
MMYLELDGQGPRYAQLTRGLKQAILSGRVAAHSRLPATRVLARDLDLSRNTVLAAYEQLAAEGFIEGRVGSGCYVAAIGAMQAPQAAKTLPRSGAARVPLSRRGERIRELWDRRIPGREHIGLRYNLQYGMPMTNPQLASAWRRELAHAAAHAQTDYPEPQGLLALREQICDYLARRRGILAAPDDVLIVSGAQQAFTLAAELLLDEGDRVLLEDPHYQGERQIMQASGAEIVGCRVDENGIVTADLPTQGRTKLALVTPSHQFPSGAVLSLSRRMELLAWAAKTGCWIIEDDYDGEFRYDARPLAALKSLDRDSRVLYFGTFSKVLFPSLRLGYIVLPPSLRDSFIGAKWLTDRGCPAIEQAALARLMADGAFERHLRAAAKSLKARRATLLAALRKYAGDEVEVADSSAGMHVLAWLTRLKPTQARQLVSRASERGLGLYLIAPYFLKSSARPGLLLGFADLPAADLQAAMRILGECLREM